MGKLDVATAHNVLETNFFFNCFLSWKTFKSILKRVLDLAREN